ncbi:2-hydroxymuconate tautomerase family protein [Pontibacterium sp. N1Y112]|uniref:Tautomerase n=1 Tax=Pontibacterium sinense TaxID=2781979 RepID=A0A8J7JZJ4_9GAMM|nr:2-hydroxymuconate tautomerase [Pontibacterium sinense]MBE9397814.1 2-hydroxymuconate tautomerase family protein [Pontibacterium sinense]
MPIVQVNMMAGRTNQQKEAMIRKVTDAVMDAVGAPEQNVTVLINEIPKTEFGIGGVSAQTLGR